MINAAVWNNFSVRDYRANTAAVNSVASPQRDELFALRPSPPPVPGVEPGRSARSFPQFTRINGHSIPRVQLPLYAEPFIPEKHCTAHLTHEEWMETLSPEIRRRLDSHGNAEHLAHLDSEARFHISCSVKHHYHAKIDEYLARLNEALESLGQSMGMIFMGAATQFFPPPQVSIASFQCPDGGPDRIVTILECGAKIFTDVPPGFVTDKFQDFVNDILNELMQLINENGALSNSQVRSFFERRFDELFPPSMMERYK